jgi:hypothetical protein
MPLQLITIKQLIENEIQQKELDLIDLQNELKVLKTLNPEALTVKYLKELLKIQKIAWNLSHHNCDDHYEQYYDEQLEDLNHKLFWEETKQNEKPMRRVTTFF